MQEEEKRERERARERERGKPVPVADREATDGVNLCAASIECKTWEAATIGNVKPHREERGK